MYEQAQNLNQVLLGAMDAYTGRTCFQIRRGRRYQEVSYRRFQALLFRLTNFFRQQGISRVALATDNCLEWMVAYVACMLAGGSVVPLRTSLAPGTLQFILKESGARLVVLQDPAHLEAIAASLRAEADERLPDLKGTLVVGGEGNLPPEATPMDAVLAKDMTPSPKELETIRSHAASVASQSLASIVYVVGQAGRPKGVVFDHARSLAAMRHMAEWFTFDEDDLAFTVRPWSEVPNLIASLHYFLSGVPNVVAPRDEPVGESLQQTTPTVMLATPHSYKRIYDEVMDKVSRMPESSQEVFRWALAKGEEYRAAGASVSPQLRQEYARADMTFFSQLRGQIGGRLRRLYATGASLPQEVADFFGAIGLPMLNVYSLIETGGFPAVSQSDARRAGSCGGVAPGFQIRIADDGEILVRGEPVMREYWRRPEETAQAFDQEGWLYSGDLGRFDADGYLHITGRKQHLMVLSTGYKITPAAIEAALNASPYVARAFVFGEAKPYVAALLLPDEAALAGHFEGEPVPPLDSPQIKGLFDRLIEGVNYRLDRWEQVKAYRLLERPGDGWEPAAAGRAEVAERYAGLIAAMYPVGVQMGGEAVTQVQIEPERLRELLEKESILDAWMADAGIEFLFELARDKGIDAPSMVNICDAAATIAQMESEEKPLSTALIVGDPARIARVLPASQIQLLHHDHIRRMRKVLITMAKIVDGLVLGYVVDKYGYVRGVHKLEVDLGQPASFLLGPQFRHHAAISRECDAVIFFVPSGGGQVRVFANGELVGRYANGDWSPDNVARVDRVVTELAEAKGYDLDLVRRVLRCAFFMSEENLGAIFLLGEANAIMARSDASEISPFAAFASADMANLSDRELINFAKQDGATVIDVQGLFRGCMVLLRPRADTQAEIGPGKGARHSSAAKMSAEASCLAITVSQDGPVTVYEDGRRVLSL